MHLERARRYVTDPAEFPDEAGRTASSRASLWILGPGLLWSLGSFGAYFKEFMPSIQSPLQVCLRDSGLWASGLWGLGLRVLRLRVPGFSFRVQCFRFQWLRVGGFEGPEYLVIVFR